MYGATSIPPVENIGVILYLLERCSVLILFFASSVALCWVQEVRHLSRGVSDHGPLCLTISVSKSPGLILWRLSRFWATDTRLQEPLMAAICNYWVLNRNLADPKVTWDALKAWLRD